MGKMTNRKYTLEFKEQAVELADRLGSAKKAADQLGIPEANVHNWRASKKSGNLTKNSLQSEVTETPEQENKRLRKEVDELRKVNQILKRAAAFFSQDHLK